MHTHMGIYPQSLESELSSCRHELEESQSKMEELERSLDDKQEAVRVVEKKSQNMVSGINLAPTHASGSAFCWD